MRFVVAIIDAFRFIRRYRERKASAEAAERAHQLALIQQLAHSLEIITEGSAKQAEENTKAITALAAASVAQAEGFSTWIKSFQVVGTPESSVVRDADEIEAENERLAAELPEEFRLAFSLHGNDNFMADVQQDLKP